MHKALTLFFFFLRISPAKLKTKHIFFFERLTKYIHNRAFTTKFLKNIAFSNSKTYFIYFNNSFYNTPNIKGTILTYNTLK